MTPARWSALAILAVGLLLAVWWRSRVPPQAAEPAVAEAPFVVPQPADWELLPPGVRRRVRAAIDACRAAPRDPAALRRLGMVYHGNQESALAAECYAAALRLGAHDAQTPYWLGLIHAEHGRSAAAEDALTLVIERAPEYALGHYHLGQVALRSANLDASINHMRQAVKLRPNDANLLCGLGRALRQANQLDEARTVLEQALDIDEQHNAAHQLLGLTLRALGQPGALEHLQRVQEQAVDVMHDPWMLEVRKQVASVTGIIALARNLIAGRRLDSAIAALQRVTQQVPTNGEAHRLLGRAWALQREPARAAQAFEAALEIDAEDVSALTALANCHVQLKDWSAAGRAVDRALRADPHDVAALALRGGLLLQAGRPREAIDVLRAALDVRSDYVAAHASLGDALLAVGRRAEALAAYQAAARLEPRWDYPRQQVDMLQSAGGGS